MTEWLAWVEGGGLIGFAAALLVLVNGRTAGISVSVFRSIEGEFGQGYWRLAFLLGLMLPGLLLMMGNASFEVGRVVILVPAGLLVGTGSYIAGGCISEHGICGLANMSRRSLVATLTFTGAAVMTVHVARHFF